MEAFCSCRWWSLIRSLELTQTVYCWAVGRSYGLGLNSSIFCMASEPLPVSSVEKKHSSGLSVACAGRRPSCPGCRCYRRSTSPSRSSPARSTFTTSQGWLRSAPASLPQSRARMRNIWIVRKGFSGGGASRREKRDHHPRRVTDRQPLGRTHMPVPRALRGDSCTQYSIASWSKPRVPRSM